MHTLKPSQPERLSAVPSGPLGLSSAEALRTHGFPQTCGHGVLSSPVPAPEGAGHRARHSQGSPPRGWREPSLARFLVGPATANDPPGL